MGNTTGQLPVSFGSSGDVSTSSSGGGHRTPRLPTKPSPFGAAEHQPIANRGIIRVTYPAVFAPAETNAANITARSAGARPVAAEVCVDEGRTSSDASSETDKEKASASGRTGAEENDFEEGLRLSIRSAASSNNSTTGMIDSPGSLTKPLLITVAASVKNKSAHKWRAKTRRAPFLWPLTTSSLLSAGSRGSPCASEVVAVLTRPASQDCSPLSNDGNCQEYTSNEIEARAAQQSHILRMLESAQQRSDSEEVLSRNDPLALNSDRQERLLIGRGSAKDGESVADYGTFSARPSEGGDAQSAPPLKISRCGGALSRTRAVTDFRAPRENVLHDHLAGSEPARRSRALSMVHTALISTASVSELDAGAEADHEYHQSHPCNCQNFAGAVPYTSEALGEKHFSAPSGMQTTSPCAQKAVTSNCDAEGSWSQEADSPGWANQPPFAPVMFLSYLSIIVIVAIATFMEALVAPKFTGSHMEGLTAAEQVVAALSLNLHSQAIGLLFGCLMIRALKCRGDFRRETQRHRDASFRAPLLPRSTDGFETSPVSSKGWDTQDLSLCEPNSSAAGYVVGAEALCFAFSRVAWALLPLAGVSAAGESKLSSLFVFLLPLVFLMDFFFYRADGITERLSTSYLFSLMCWVVALSVDFRGAAPLSAQGPWKYQLESSLVQETLFVKRPGAVAASSLILISVLLYVTAYGCSRHLRFFSKNSCAMERIDAANFRVIAIDYQSVLLSFELQCCASVVFLASIVTGEVLSGTQPSLLPLSSVRPWILLFSGAVPHAVLCGAALLVFRYCTAAHVLGLHCTGYITSGVVAQACRQMTVR